MVARKLDLAVGAVTPIPADYRRVVDLGLLRAPPLEALESTEVRVRAVLEAARRERVLPTVAAHLEVCRRDPETAALLGQLRDEQQRHARALAAATHDAFAALRDVQALILKGQSTELFYPEGYTRHANDVDILVGSEADTELVIRRLLGAGFRFKTLWLRASGRMQSARFSGVASMYHTLHEVSIDLHAGVYPAYGSRFGVDGLDVDLWRRSEAVLSESGIRRLGREDALVVLVAHNHANGSRTILRDLNDLYALAAKTLDWEYVLDALARNAMLGGFNRLLAATERIYGVELVDRSVRMRLTPFKLRVDTLLLRWARRRPIPATVLFHAGYIWQRLRQSFDPIRAMACAVRSLLYNISTRLPGAVGGGFDTVPLHDEAAQDRRVVPIFSLGEGFQVRPARRLSLLARGLQWLADVGVKNVGPIVASGVFLIPACMESELDEEALRGEGWMCCGLRDLVDAAAGYGGAARLARLPYRRTLVLAAGGVLCMSADGAVRAGVLVELRWLLNACRRRRVK